MRIAVLDLATPFAGMETQPRAGDLICRWLTPVMPDAEVEIHDIGTGAPLPPLDAFDGLVLSGSERSVYDGTPWIAPLKALLVAARDAGKPMFGICFGHQIMAEAFGGKVENAGLGNIMGARRFTIDGVGRDAWVWHQDQVVALPDGAAVVGAADYCPAAVLRYDFGALSVQFHPEYTAQTLRYEIELVAGRCVPQAAADAALTSMALSDVAPDLMALDAAAVLRGPQAIARVA